MGLNSAIRSILERVVKRRGYGLVPTASLYPWQLATEVPRRHCSELPAHTIEYLKQDNPRLLELQDRYRKFDEQVTAPSVWVDGHVSPEDMMYFRGDNAYIWQLRGQNMNELGYALTTYYLKSIDKLGLFDRLTEDTSFGNYTCVIDNKVVSRDLLDSIIEIYFLEKHLRISALKRITVLDIGAGYGRLAHRMVSAWPNKLAYICTDAVAVSTVLCEYYLRYRSCGPSVKVVPLDEIQAVVGQEDIDLAINIHSFSECTLPAIEWWIALLRKGNVKFFMIVPNAVNGSGDRLLTNRNEDFQSIIERNGYRLRAKEPKYRDPIIQKFGLNPTYHYLFELK